MLSPRQISLNGGCKRGKIWLQIGRRLVDSQHVTVTVWGYFLLIVLQWLIPKKASAVVLQLRIWPKRCMPLYLFKGQTAETGTPSKSWLIFVPANIFQGSVKGAGMSYLGVDELEKSADICSPLLLLLPGRVRSGWADFVVFSQSLTRIFCFTSSQIWCQIAASVLTRRRLCRPPRPRLLQRNNGGKNSTLKPLLYSLWRHRMRCPRGHWEMKCLQWLLCFLLDIEQPLKIRL